MKIDLSSFKSHPKPRRVYIPVIYKFWISQAIAVAWLVFSIYLSIPWIKDLSLYIGGPLAILVIIGLAYIPGYLNAFLVSSLLLDRQPSFYIDSPLIPITILIAARNEALNIEQTLDYIARQDYRGRIQIIVVDNDSTDGTLEIAVNTAKRLELSLVCISEKKLGKHFALNTGLQHVQTPWMITLDADTILHKSAIRYLVARMFRAPEQVCAVAGSILVKNSRESFVTRLQEWDYFLGIASVKRLQGLYQGTLVAQGAFSIYKTERLKEIGGWPDAIGEDIVLTWQLLKENGKVFFEPLAVAFTHAPSRFTHLARQRNRWARGMIEGLKRIKPWQQPRLPTKQLTGINLIMPFLDIIYTFFWLPGLILSFFGVFVIVGPYSLFVLPITILSNLILYLYQRHVFKRLDLQIRRNWVGFFSYVLLYQMFMSPVAVWGYFQELLNLKRVWK